MELVGWLVSLLV